MANAQCSLYINKKGGCVLDDDLRFGLRKGIAEPTWWNHLLQCTLLQGRNSCSSDTLDWYTGVLWVYPMLARPRLQQQSSQ